MDKIKIKGMSCQHCVGSVKKTLEEIDGVSDVEVSLETGEASFKNDGVPQNQLRDAINKIGFEPLD